MNELSDELIYMLSWYLPKQNAKNLGMTCKKFYNCMLKRIWDDVRLRNYTKIDLRALSRLPIRILRVQNFLWMELLALEIHRFSVLQDFFFEYKIVELREIEMLESCAFAVHVSTKNLLRYVNADEFINLLRRMKNVHLSIEANGFQFKIDDLRKIGGIPIERFDTGGICFCGALDDYRIAFLQTLELLQPIKIDVKPLPLCCDGLLKFDATDLIILSAYPVRSFYIGLIKWQSPLILNPPLRTIKRLFEISTLKTIFTNYELEFLNRMSIQKNVSVIRLW